MQVEIRRAGPGDEAALALVGAATFLETYAHMIPCADMLAFCAQEHGAARYAEWLADGACRIWIAEAAETCAPVGYAVVTRPDLPIPTAADDLELKRLYALPRLHGSGLGPRLMACAITGATNAGARRLLVGVHSDNSRAIAFYARQGFVQAGKRRFRVGASVFDDLVLARPLPGLAT
jgi:GNAT superfamily N-acetyltransferase